ncbi:MAG TPA: cupin domain-containing protein [Thermoanaerobaculia bacterium]
MRTLRALLLLAALLALPPTRAAEEAAALPHAFEAGWLGEPVCEVLYETDSVRVGRCSFPPGVGHERHFHRPHFGYVLTGGTMRIEDAEGVETVETRAGATWSSDEVTVHEVLNVGDTTASYLVIEPKAAMVK